MLGCAIENNISIQDSGTRKIYDSFEIRKDGECVFILEGTVLNFIDQEDASHRLSNNTCEAIRSIYGSYVFASYCQENGLMIVGNDLLSKKSLFYLSFEKGLLFSTSFFEIVHEARKMGINLHQDKAAIDDMCGRGVFQYDETYFCEIKFLMPYQYIEYQIQSNKMIVHKIDEPKQIAEISVEDAVDELDRLFYEGCKLQYKKSLSASGQEYVTLS